MTRTTVPDAERLLRLSDAFVSGAGLTHAVRAAAGALDASLVVTDDAGATLAVAARSPADERALLAGGAPVLSYELRRGERLVGRLGVRPPGGRGAPPAALVRVARTLIAAEVERRGANERAARAEEAGLAHALLAPDRGSSEPLLARAEQLGVRLHDGAAVVLVCGRPARGGPEEWDARLLLLVRRAARAAALRALAAVLDPPADAVAGDAHVAVIVPAQDEAAVRMAAEAIGRGLIRSEPGARLALGHSRRSVQPCDLRRARREAALATRLAGMRGGSPSAVAFEDTGAYRLLLSFPRTGSAELRRFYRDTVEPLAVHDAAHRTELVHTLQTFLECDGSFARAGRRIHAHRHTVRYRLRHVRELTGLDANSTSGREQLGLGLKAMRVLAVYETEGLAAA